MKHRGSGLVLEYKNGYRIKSTSDLNQAIIWHAIMYIFKLSLFTIIILSAAVFYLLLLIVFYPWRKGLGPILLQWASKLFLVIFRGKINHADRLDDPRLKNRGCIIISNHVCLLDIFLLSALFRTIYVSKIEVKYYPLFGQIGNLMGIIFLKRDSSEDRHILIRTIAEKSQDRVITIFPQGTTSSLSDPLPFKCGIFKAAEINQNVIFVPVTIQYEEDREIAWTGDQLLFENIKKICSQSRIPVNVHVHQCITIDDYKNKTISEVCRIAQERVLMQEPRDEES